VTGGIPFDNGTDYWNWIVGWFVKDNKEKLKKRFYKNTNRKSN
jgi:hypothetical protein